MSQMKEAFGDTNHGQELEEIHSRLNKFANFRRGEKPERREQLTELAGHLNTLNASCRNNNRPVYEASEGESVPELESAWDDMQEQEAAYQTSLQDAYILFQRLEATLNNFNAGADQVETFVQDTQMKVADVTAELAAGQEDNSLLSVDVVESHVGKSQDMASQIETRSAGLQEMMSPLVAELSRGGHRQAEHCQQRMVDMAAALAQLSDGNAQLRGDLDLELTRQRHINGLLKDAALQETRLNNYLTTVQNHIDLGTVSSGSGVTAVQTRLDSLHADHIDQQDTSSGRLSRLGKLLLFLRCSCVVLW